MATAVATMNEEAAARHRRVQATEARIAKLVGVINTATAALVDTLADVINEDMWEGPGIRSPEHWVTWQCGVSYGHALALVTSARRLAELPRTAAAFREGALSPDQVAVIARRTPPERDEEVAELARSLMVPQLTRALRSLPPRPKPQPEIESGPTREVVFGNRDPDGWWWCRMLLPPDEGAAVQAALEAGRDLAFHEAHPDADTDQNERGDISWADGAGRVAEAAIAGLAAELGRSTAHRYQVLLHVDVDNPDRPAHLHWGRRYRRGSGGCCPVTAPSRSSSSRQVSRSAKAGGNTPSTTGSAC